MTIDDLLKAHDSYVLVGQGGSGKSEMALYLCSRLPQGGKLLDLDQTKAVFRSRTYARENPHFEVISGLQFMDAPTVPFQFRDAILHHEEGKKTIIDLPADQKGLLILGQVLEDLKKEKACVFFLYNPYRNPMNKKSVLLRQLEAVEAFLPGLRLYLILNPTLGLTRTQREDVEEGVRRVEEALKGSPYFPAFVLADEKLGLSGGNYLPIKVHFNQGNKEFLDQ